MNSLITYGELNLNISLDIAKLERLEDKSYYNHTYYRVYPQGPDCSFYNGFNVLLEYCDEDEGYFEYTFGRFNGKDFIKALSWIHYGFDSVLEK